MFFEYFEYSTRRRVFLFFFQNWVIKVLYINENTYYIKAYRFMSKVFCPLTKTRGFADQKLKKKKKRLERTVKLKFIIQSHGVLCWHDLCRLLMLTSSLISRHCQVFLNNWTAHHTQMTGTSKHWNSSKEFDAWLINKCSAIVPLVLNLSVRMFPLLTTFFRFWWRPRLSQI